MGATGDALLVWMNTLSEADRKSRDAAIKKLGDFMSGGGYVERVATRYDLSGRTELIATPYEYDVSGIVPAGAIAVDVYAFLYLVSSTGQIGASSLAIWDYDAGAYDQFYTMSKGLLIRGPALYSSTAQTKQISTSARVSIGSSRKLYCGMTTIFYAYYLVIRGWWL